MIDRSLLSSTGHVEDAYFEVRHGLVDGIAELTGPELATLVRGDLPYTFFGTFSDFCQLDSADPDDRFGAAFAGAWIGLYSISDAWEDEIAFYFELEEDAVLAKLTIGNSE